MEKNITVKCGSESVTITVNYTEGRIISSGSHDTPPEYDEDEVNMVTDEDGNDITDEAFKLFDSRDLVFCDAVEVSRIQDLIELGWIDE